MARRPRAEAPPLLPPRTAEDDLWDLTERRVVALLTVDGPLTGERLELEMERLWGKEQARFTRGICSQSAKIEWTWRIVIPHHKLQWMFRVKDLPEPKQTPEEEAWWKSTAHLRTPIAPPATEPVVRRKRKAKAE